MEKEELQQLIEVISKGDTTFVGRFCKRPGGRKYLENITVILINTMDVPIDQKRTLFLGFVEVLNRMEERLHRQDIGDGILKTVFATD